MEDEDIRNWLNDTNSSFEWINVPDESSRFRAFLAVIRGGQMREQENRSGEMRKAA